ncbi:WhiB family transcriptional regulator [Nocardioides sp.]|uniref:WhiB family transcriptional regulator n=1 Tax=Nocardioides sp. TaxID=35761 RepID=UPI00260B82CA|nr:WhiB family transcriptional regulator [Nocardioides sp.]MDI6912209.1 WhiB family transcriptional regulator [Nocardioides sp.]
MIPELLAIDWPARSVWFALARALDDLADRGRLTPCQRDPAPFHSELRADRAEAAAACRACPARLACAVFALANDEPAGVWGGVDLTPSSAAGGSKAARRAALERAAAGVPDPDEAAETPAQPRGPAAQVCEECGAAYLATRRGTRFCSGACRSRVSRRGFPAWLTATSSQAVR